MKGLIVDLMPSFLVRMFASPYVSGNSIEKGIKTADKLWKDGIRSTLDLLGEAVDSREMVDYNISIYSELIQSMKGKDYATVSIKPSALGIHESVEYCEECIRKILVVADEANTPITLDMEDHPFTDMTLLMYKNLLKDFPNFGTVLQTRLFRTEDDIKSLEGLKCRVRICIGIYNEPPEIALQDKPSMKRKLIEFTEKLITDGHFVEVATHDKETIAEVLELAEKNGWTSEHMEFQQLLGVPMKAVQQQILSKGYEIRLYVPFATDWKYAIPYLKRRLKNNPKMVIYVISQLFQRILGRH